MDAIIWSAAIVPHVILILELSNYRKSLLHVHVSKLKVLLGSFITPYLPVNTCRTTGSQFRVVMQVY